MFIRIIKDSILRQKRRKTITIIAIALGTAIATSLISISLEIGDKLNQELKSYGANIRIIPASQSIPVDIPGIDRPVSTMESYLNESDLIQLKEIFWKHNIIGFVPTLSAKVTLNSHPVTLVGTWFEKTIQPSGSKPVTTGAKQINNYWSVDGYWLSDDMELDNVLVGRKLAQENRLQKGDKINLMYKGTPVSVTIAGILTTGGDEESQIFTSLARVQSLTGLNGKVSEVKVSALTTPDNMLAEKYNKDPQSLTPEEFERFFCTPYVWPVAKQIQEAIPNSVAQPIRQVAQSEGVVLNKIKLLMLVVTVAALLCSGLGVMSTVTTTVLERRQEIGLLKAIGASDINIVFLFLSELILLGTIGALCGSGIGMILAKLISHSVFGTTIHLNWIMIPITLLMAFVIVFLGSVFPLRTALRLDPVTVLHENA